MNHAIFSVRCVCLLLLPVTSNFVFAEPPDSLWSRKFGGIRFDDAQGIASAPDGGMAIFGRTQSFGADNGSQYNELFFVLVDSNGVVQCSTHLPGVISPPCDDRGYAIAVRPEGGYILAGTSQCFSGAWDFWVVAIDHCDSIAWSRTYGGNGEQECLVVKPMESGYLLAGYRQGSTGPLYDRDFWMLFIDSDGDEICDLTYDPGPFDATCHGAAITPDGGAILVGSRYYANGGSRDLFIVKSSSACSLQWTRTFGGIGDEDGEDIKLLPDGGSVIGALTSSQGSGGTDFWLLRLNEDGDTLWTRTYGGLGDEQCFDILVDDDGGFLLSGASSSYCMNSSFDFWLLKTDSTGDSLWSVAFGGAGYEECRGLLKFADGGFALAGCTSIDNSECDDIWLIRTTPYYPSLQPQGLVIQSIAGALRLAWQADGNLSYHVYSDTCWTGHFEQIEGATLDTFLTVPLDPLARVKYYRMYGRSE